MNIKQQDLDTIQSALTVLVQEKGITKEEAENVFNRLTEATKEKQWIRSTDEPKPESYIPIWICEENADGVEAAYYNEDYNVFCDYISTFPPSIYLYWQYADKPEPVKNGETNAD